VLSIVRKVFSFVIARPTLRVPLSPTPRAWPFDAGPAADALSEREVQVLRCVARGAANKEVAIRLHISEETVKVHMKHILEKLHATDRTHAVTIALSRGIIEL
jgi:DNA-binding NarL/FixJ family response regulator